MSIRGPSGLEAGVGGAFTGIGRDRGTAWPALRARMREGGRFHVETY